MSAEEQHEHRILGGHKATLHNPSLSLSHRMELMAQSSEAAKEHSREVLKEAGIDVKDVDGTTTFEKHQTHEGHHNTRGHIDPRADGETEEQHKHRVLGGYKAGTLSNPKTSEEAKEHAREKLREAGEDY